MNYCITNNKSLSALLSSFYLRWRCHRGHRPQHDSILIFIIIRPVTFLLIITVIINTALLEKLVMYKLQYRRRLLHGNVNVNIFWQATNSWIYSCARWQYNGYEKRRNCIVKKHKETKIIQIKLYKQTLIHPPRRVITGRTCQCIETMLLSDCHRVIIIITATDHQLRYPLFPVTGLVFTVFTEATNVNHAGGIYLVDTG